MRRGLGRHPRLIPLVAAPDVEPVMAADSSVRDTDSQNYNAKHLKKSDR
jgi:hypothetical protein